MKNKIKKELKTIKDKILSANKVLLYPHTNCDGDALGSSVALCLGIRELGKECYIMIDEEIPRNLAFLDRGYTTSDKNIFDKVDLSICVDCGDMTRFEERKDVFLSAGMNACIDHHRTTSPFCQANYILPSAAATGELIYELLEYMSVPITNEIASAIFTAILTDTGKFQYSNTTGRTHEIVAKLYDADIDSNGICVELYENVREEKVRIEAMIISNMKLIGGGKGAVARVSRDMLDMTGASMDETDGVVETLRSIGSVEISALLKENEDGSVKVSLRAKTRANVAEIAVKFGGGGHEKAAGFTFHGSLEDAEAQVKKEIEDAIDRYGY